VILEWMKRSAKSTLRLKQFGRAIERFRKGVSLTQADLATDLDVSESTVYRLEIGEVDPTSELILKLAKPLNKEVAEIAQLALWGERNEPDWVTAKSNIIAEHSLAL